MKYLKETLFVGVILMIVQACMHAAPKSARPAFSWDTIPVYIHFAKSDGALTDAEINQIASMSSFVCLEKGHGIKEFGSTEEGIAHDARRLKARNPEMKVLFYWNSFINYQMYDVSEVVKKNPEWIFRDKEGMPIYKTKKLEQYNLLNPEFRQWWASMAGEAVNKYGCDGIFIDATLQVKRPIWMKLGWGLGNEGKLTDTVIDMMQRAREAMGGQSLLLYNGIRSSDFDVRNDWSEYVDYADGMMCEHFTAFSSRSKESIASDIESISRMAPADE